MQDIGHQPGGATAIPTDCTKIGGKNLTNENTSAQLGANGILGIGLFTNDCDACLVHAISAAYYACTTAGCSGSAVTTAQVLKNPVALFLHDNNGVLIDLPAVSNSGSAGVSGSLIFGIGTQGNNALSTAVIYSTDSSGNFTTSYTPVGTVTPATLTSFIDSGSNGLFFRDAGIPIGTLSAGFYCPPSPLSLILLCHQIWQDVGIA